jgi:hypothetical protein
MKKYKLPVVISTIASKTIGWVECDTITEFNEKASEMWESKGYEAPTVYACNDFDHGDWDIDEIEEAELYYYINE